MTLAGPPLSLKMKYAYLTNNNTPERPPRDIAPPWTESIRSLRRPAKNLNAFCATHIKLSSPPEYFQLRRRQTMCISKHLRNCGPGDKIRMKNPLRLALNGISSPRKGLVVSSQMQIMDKKRWETGKFRVHPNREKRWLPQTKVLKSWAKRNLSIPYHSKLF